MPMLAVKPWLPPPYDDFYLTHATVIDTVQGRLLDGPQAVKVVNGQIVSVQPQSSIGFERGVVAYDLQGKYLCPGLIDAHVHVCAVPGVEVKRHDRGKNPNQPE